MIRRSPRRSAFGGPVFALGLALLVGPFLHGAAAAVRTQRDEQVRGRADAAAADLEPRHRAWLEEKVAYIISPLERRSFLALRSAEARDAFVGAFWRNRDPTPGTARNEAREEHRRRLAYVDRYLGAETPREGWRTDRGRIYMQLGEPADRLRYPDPRTFYPLELWFYRADPGLSGLPPFFYVMFYRPNQSGEYRIYDPVTDGPSALVKEVLLQTADPRQIVQRLRQRVGHEVAQASINLVPTETTSFSDPRPSLRNAFLFDAIEEAPFRRVDVGYARSFVSNRGEVDASVTYDPLPLQLSALAFWDQRGLPYLHYGVEVDPEQVLLGQVDDEYFLELALGIEVTDLRGRTIVFGGDEVERHFDSRRAEEIAAEPLAYFDRIGLVPGVYDLAVTLRNRVTDDSAVARRRVSVPYAGGDAVLSDLLVARGTRGLDGRGPEEARRALRFGGEQLVPAAGGRVAVGSEVVLFAQLVGASGTGAGDMLEVGASLLDMSGTTMMEIADVERPMATPPAPTPLRLSLPLGATVPGSYRLALFVTLPGGQSLTRERQVEVVPARLSPIPRVLVAREAAPGDIDEYESRGWQHLRKGELTAAEGYFEAGLERDPGNVALRRALAGIRMSLERYAEAAAILGSLARAPGSLRSDLLVLSEALRKAGAAEEAAAAARRFITEGRATAAGYNALAEALLDLGKTAEAVGAWESSLGLEPEQPEVRERLARIDSGSR